MHRTVRRPVVFILLNGDNRFECDENATTDSRSDEESDEIIVLIAFFIICIFSFLSFPLTSATTTRSIGARRGSFSGAGAFTLRMIPYVKCLPEAVIATVSGDIRTSTSLL
ncbi:hypothetical protein HanXRQr2_Chr15g0682311 [Helianthus annuus]|uniref:Uncharacterized protein n=1 Tax=Helianthus annuus TaxID=4232 RepID=A0A9K3DYZ4_HELAN|nr:hypothetical protein HanXRQr2_Chr15g0682311 [Helianthus annuus]KAJ0454529.1 hypothetical protein HanIR_Chr15g0741111 [Helianthus annuus]KAJ0830337.1 hypothetical protein HanPSC8_Chr15g0654251 [Helianthus annuus]